MIETKIGKMNPDIQNNQRIFGLDVIRATAIMMVVFSHVYYLIDSSNALLISISGIFGFFGVELFFVLSGFLIGTILLKKYINESFSFKEVFIFLKRRWFRTLPNYYLVLILNIILAFVLGYSIDGLANYFFFLQNFNTYKINIFTESWSLSVEEWAYIVIPFVLFFSWSIFKKNRKKTFIITVLLFIFFFHILRYFVYLENSFSDMTRWNLELKSLTIYRIDSILVGFVTAWLHLFYKEILQKYKVYLFIVSLHLFIFQFAVMNVIGFDIISTPLYYKVFYFTLTSFTIFLALPLFIYWKTSKIIYEKPIQLISKISYSIYLLHYSIISVLMKYALSSYSFELPNSLIIVIYLFITLSLSYVLYRFYEKPIMDLREKSF